MQPNIPPEPITPQSPQPAQPTPTPIAMGPSASTPTQPIVESPVEIPGAGTSVLSGAKALIGFLFSWIIIPGLLVFFVHNFVFQAWYVDGQSMEPTFQNGDYLIVAKWETSFRKLTGQSSKLNIKRGDVVIFNPPGYTSDIYFIKRAIGLPGERIVIKSGVIKIFNDTNPTGLTLAEPYTANIPLEGDIDTTVRQGELFVVGDNRNPGASHDSRAIGAVPLDRLVGTANLRLLPVSQFGSVAHPSYSATTSINGAGTTTTQTP